LQDSDFKDVRSVYTLHRNDFMVKSKEHWLKDKFKQTDLDILQYLLIDGEFEGAVLGHFKNGPFIIEDIILDLPEDEIRDRKYEIIGSVYTINNRESSPIKKFNGKGI
jgi:hypothetical protein